MTASGIKLWERLMELSRTTAPLRIKGRRKVPPNQKPAGPRLIAGRGRPRRHPTTWRQYGAIIFWTLIVYACWVGWNYLVWGWY